MKLARCPAGLAARNSATALVASLMLATAAGATPLTVQVGDAQSGGPIAGAFVMVGPAPGSPFAGNYGWTDGSGTIVFDDASLAVPQTVTAGHDDYSLTTVYEAALTAIHVPLFTPVIDSTMGGTITHIEGEVDNIAFTNNDGNLDFALILPAIRLSDFVLGDRLTFSFGMEMVEFPIIGEVEMPENSYGPDQVEYYVLHFEKTPWRLDVAGDRSTTFASVSGRMAIDDLIGGGDLNDVERREVGVERDVYVGGPMDLDIDSDRDLSADLEVVLGDVPPGSLVQVVSGASIPTALGEEVVSYDLYEGNSDEITTLTLATCAPAGDMSDATNVVMARYSDDSLDPSFSAGVMAREGFLPPHTETIDSWMYLPELTQIGANLLWEDPTHHGVSPSPTWTRSALGLRPMAGEGEVSVAWRVYARAEGGMVVLPALPAEAPGPPGGLPDPDDTPAADELYWSFTAANACDDPEAAAWGLLENATHWTMRRIPIEYAATDVTRDGLPGRMERVALRAAPNPGRDAVTLSWTGPARGEGTIEIFAADGRRVLRFAVSMATPALRWHGRDADGTHLPAGLYWATLRRGTQLLDRTPIVWVR